LAIVGINTVLQGDQAGFGIGQVIGIGVFEQGGEDWGQLRQGLGAENGANVLAQSVNRGI
jgi:hypothetical protein